MFTRTIMGSLMSKERTPASRSGVYYRDKEEHLGLRKVTLILDTATVKALDRLVDSSGITIKKGGRNEAVTQAILYLDKQVREGKVTARYEYQKLRILLNIISYVKEVYLENYVLEALNDHVTIPKWSRSKVWDTKLIKAVKKKKQEMELELKKV